MDAVFTMIALGTLIQRLCGYFVMQAYNSVCVCVIYVLLLHTNRDMYMSESYRRTMQTQIQTYIQTDIQTDGQTDRQTAQKSKHTQ